jgi:hypothetical protein
MEDVLNKHAWTIIIFLDMVYTFYVLWAKLLIELLTAEDVFIQIVASIDIVQTV